MNPENRNSFQNMKKYDRIKIKLNKVSILSINFDKIGFCYIKLYSFREDILVNEQEKNIYGNC